MEDEPHLLKLESIAADIFFRHGIDFATVQRAGGWTNAVWLADGLVLRLSTKPGNENLLREAELSTFFPAGAGYPRLVNSGVTEGHAWTLAQRLPGKCLGGIWSDLTLEERVSALQGLWARAEAVHSVSSKALAGVLPTRAWFNSNDPAEAETSLAHLADEQILTRPERSALKISLSRFWKALPEAPCVLCHGDLTLDNVFWHEGQVIALLDFEFAVLAPTQLDLNHLVKCVYGPGKDENRSSTTGAQQVRRLRQTVNEIALPMVEQPSSQALLVGYAILLELWLLQTWLAHPEGEGPLEQWDPLRRLRSLADGNDGYLALLVHA